MALPARKLEDIDPDIRPNLHAVEGVSNAGPGHASLEAVKNQEHKPESLNNEKSVAEQEAKGSNALKSSWKNNTSAAKEAANMLKPGALGKIKAIKNLVKQKGPLGAIIIVVIGYFVLLTVMLSPAYIIVQFKEALVDKLDLSLATMDTRTTKLLKSKTTSGSCDGIVPILCKYRSMSTKQIANFEKAGIKVNTTDTLFGRKRPTSFEFRGGPPILATDFNTHVLTNREFQKAVFRAYHPKFAGFADIMWNKAQRFLKIAKSAVPNIKAGTLAEGLKEFGDEIVDHTKPIDPKNIDTKKHPVTGEVLTDPVDISNAADSYKKYKQAYESGEKAAKEASEKAAEGTVDEIISVSKQIAKVGRKFLSVSETAEDLCDVYLAAKTVAYMSKIMRITQLAFYANQFLKIADEIKAGGASGVDSPDPDTVAFYGSILAGEVTTLDESYVEKSATASWGYRYAAYNDTTSMPMPMSAKSFVVGGGMPGVFGSMIKWVDEVFPGAYKKCSWLTSWWGMLANLVGGILIAVFSGGGSLLVKGEAAIAKLGIKTVTKWTLKEGLKVAKDLTIKASKGAVKGIALSLTEKTAVFWMAVQVALFFMPTLLKDIFLAQLSGPNMIGANAGDALTSGASGIMAMSAKFGGNAPINYKQAADYATYSETVAEKYNSLYTDNSIANQFNGMDRNTFMGKMVAELAPYSSKLSSLSGVFSSIVSVAAKSISSIFSPNSRAYYQSTDAEFQMCDDTEYKGLGVATDPFCNVRYGIPPSMLENTDPESIARNLLQEIEGHRVVPFIEADTGDPTEVYKKFITNCINRTEPLTKSTEYRHDNGWDYGGLSGRVNNGASECMFNTSHSVDDHDNTVCGDGWPAPDPTPHQGEVYFSYWREKIGLCGDPLHPEVLYNVHYYYVGNAYLYMYYIDQLRIERGMDDEEY